MAKNGSVGSRTFEPPNYSECSMKKYQHVLVYLGCVILITALAYLFYRMLLLSLVIGIAAGVYLEQMFAQSVIKRRRRAFRLQFREFLENMGVAARSGDMEIKALESSLESLSIAYNEDTDIVQEVKYIIHMHKDGGIQLKVLFQNLADRVQLEDVKSFATIYSVIEGKSDRYGDILSETSQIIGDKIEIEQEIQTAIASAKSETNMMLIMPIVIVGAMSALGGGFMDSLFTTMVGHMAATVGLILFAVSYVIAVRASDIDV
ncbi:MAG: hypothetical protein LUH19_06000 [Lachnospiraceae bacterium]|nr:hypothetical protein [Lachnospiraceae bacterium]